MDEKTFFQYWLTVAKKAKQEASKSLGMFGRFLALIVSSIVTSFVAILISGTPTTAIATGIITAFIWLVVWVLFFTLKVTQQPIIIHNEQVGKLTDLSAKLEAINNHKPYLVPYGLPYKDRRLLTNGQATFATSNPEFFHVSFANNPKNRTEQATARNVVAWLTFYDAQERLMQPIIGRWSSAEQPTTRSIFDTGRDLLPVDFGANGLPHELTVAMKHSSDHVIYAFNNNTYAYPDWRKPEFLIDRKLIYIHVRLTGDNIGDIDFWFLLKNTQDSWDITQTESPNLSKTVMPSL